ncbi:MAG: hypothetical protein P4L27_01115 [Ignavibacteriaceae bacterium]|nr:hypothetical protein [Ignavibacteriaceae bacterium]
MERNGERERGNNIRVHCKDGKKRRKGERAIISGCIANMVRNGEREEGTIISVFIVKMKRSGERERGQ